MSVSLLNYLFPQSCFLCGASSAKLLCPACYQDLPFPQHHCSVCACSLPMEIDTCAQCLREPPHFVSVKSALRYDYPADKLIQAAKYAQNLTVLNYLGNLMTAAFRQQTRPDVLLPVPLHPRALRARGFNQAVELGKTISRAYQIPLAREVAHCVRHKSKQTRLSAKERKSNVRGSFQVAPLAKNWQHIVLVDDVVTTGATVNELARMCRQAGAQRVEVWCCMRNQLRT